MKIGMQKVVFRIAGILELILSIIIILLVIVSIYRLAFDAYYSGKNIEIAVSDILSTSFSVIIAIEFVKMLVKHSVVIAIEVLTFSVVRQMIVKHLEPLSILTCIAGLTILLFARKYLLTDEDYLEKSEYTSGKKINLWRIQR